MSQYTRVFLLVSFDLPEARNLLLKLICSFFPPLGVPSDQSSGTSSPLCDSGLHLNYHPNNTVHIIASIAFTLGLQSGATQKYLPCCWESKRSKLAVLSGWEGQDYSLSFVCHSNNNQSCVSVRWGMRKRVDSYFF